MSIGFGFSVGDFISAVELVSTVIDALRSSSSASTEYRELISQLLSLESALLQVKRESEESEKSEESQLAEVIALLQAASQCQRTIDAFLERVKAYQPHLGNDRSENGVTLGNMKDGTKRGWMKVKWAICKKEDIRKFQADSAGHTASIQLLLATVQMRKSTIHEKKQDERQLSIAGRVQENYFNYMQKLVAITEQGKQLLETTRSILRTNLQVFHIVLQIQNFITTIPCQVDRQQPVYLMDAIGRTSPFHLEFVRSADALLAVLMVNFKKHGKGAEKIGRGEFAIENFANGRDIVLKGDWETCFSPGQRVSMSMVFTRSAEPGLPKDLIGCPNCFDYAGPSGYSLQGAVCTHCGTTFRRTPTTFVKKEYEDKLDALMDDMKHDSEKTLDRTVAKELAMIRLCPGIENDWRKRNAEICYLPDELLSFKRVRIIDAWPRAFVGKGWIENAWRRPLKVKEPSRYRDIGCK